MTGVNVCVFGCVLEMVGSLGGDSQGTMNTQIEIGAGTEQHHAL